MAHTLVAFILVARTGGPQSDGERDLAARPLSKASTRPLSKASKLRGGGPQSEGERARCFTRSEPPAASVLVLSLLVVLN